MYPAAAQTRVFILNKRYANEKKKKRKKSGEPGLKKKTRRAVREFIWKERNNLTHSALLAANQIRAVSKQLRLNESFLLKGQIQ